MASQEALCKEKTRKKRRNLKSLLHFSCTLTPPHHFESARSEIDMNVFDISWYMHLNVLLPLTNQNERLKSLVWKNKYRWEPIAAVLFIEVGKGHVRPSNHVWMMKT